MLLLLGTVVYGVLGYVALVDGASPLDALYWTFLTVGGVGFRDTEKFGVLAEVFSISLIILLVVGVALSAGIATDLLASGEMAKLRVGRRRTRMIDELTDHYVICGYGRVGRAVTEELTRGGIRFVVADIDARYTEELTAKAIPFLIADPSHDAVLIEAGILRARGLVCGVDSDAVNVFIALTARGLNPDLMIVARASEAESVGKLERAGADAVVSPYELTGRAIAKRALEAHVAITHPLSAEPSTVS